MPLGEASLGMGVGWEASGGACGAAAPCSLAQTQPLPQVPTLSSGPSFTICTPGARPHQRLHGP